SRSGGFPVLHETGIMKYCANSTGAPRNIPILTIIAGPNGSGKSTLTGRLTFEGRENLLDPDAIAKHINPSDPGRAAVTAGREVIKRTRGYLLNCESFSIETTLSGGGYLETMREAG